MREPFVSIVVGSESDRVIAKKAEAVLKRLRISYETRVFSCHRNHQKLDAYLASRKASVYIAIAGLAAHLPGYIAARTKKPVIGVPVSKRLGGLDALLSIAQMPKGVPVACVGIDSGENGAYLAARMLEIMK